MRNVVSKSYFDQILEKREPQIWQVFNFVGIQFCDHIVLKLFACTKFCENGQIAKITKFHTFKVTIGLKSIAV